MQFFADENYINFYVFLFQLHTSNRVNSDKWSDRDRDRLPSLWRWYEWYNDNWDLKDATVVCRMLGFFEAKNSFHDSSFGFRPLTGINSNALAVRSHSRESHSWLCPWYHRIYLSLYCGNDGVTIAMMELEFIVNKLDLINLIDMKYTKHAF